MDFLLSAWTWWTANGAQLVAAVGGLLGGALALSLLIPGEQPDNFLQSAVDLVKKFSRK